MADTQLRYPWKRLVYPLGSEPPYRDPNGWVSSQPAGHLTTAPMPSYQDLPVVVLLGERGVGKSDIISNEARRLQAEGADCHFVDLPELGPDAAVRLASALGPAQSDAPRFVLLDSLDEAVDNNPGAWQLLVGCLRELGAEGQSRLRLRIACRSSRWPTRLKDALETMWPGQVSYLGVAGLTRVDVVTAAELNGLDESFVKQLEQRRLVVPLASWPVTLNPLLHAAVQNLPLPANTVEAFSQACERLVTETNPARRDGITANHPSPADLLAVGRRLAAALQFGTDGTLVDLLDEGSGLPLAMLARGTEPDSAGREVVCTEHLLRKLTESALLSPLGPRRWGFAHHSFQEFLAAQHLQVHQTAVQVRRAILLAGAGRSKHVVASQREVAAWLAVSDDDLFEEILACDPEVLLLADPAVRSVADRRKLTDALLCLVRQDFTVQLDPLLLYRLDHPDLAGQLAPRLTSDQTPNELYAALMIARACPQPTLAGRLMTLAENQDLSESLRSLAVEAVTVDSAESRSRLLHITASTQPDLAGAALARLWPRYMSTADMLNSLPQPRPNRLAAAWGFMHALPGLLQPANVTEALAWAAKAMQGRNGRDHVTLAIRILAWAIRTCEPLDASHDADVDDSVIIQFGEALVNLIHSDYFHEPGMPLEELGTELAARPSFRRAVACTILEQASVVEIGDLTFSTALCLFPQQDAAYWAFELPSLAPAVADKLKFPLRNPPDDQEGWVQVWELAQADDLVRKTTAHWYALPVNHPLAHDSRRQRDAEQRDQARRAARRYDETALNARLAALSAGKAPARQGWIEVIIDVYKTAEGDEVAFDHSLDLSSAPSFPPPGGELHNRLIHAAAAVLQNAPLITADQIDPARIGLLAVPELCALSLLAQSGHTDLCELDTSRWAGLTLALIFVPTVPDDRDLRNRLLTTGLAHSGHEVEEALSGLLDPLRQHQLTQVMGRLVPGRTPGLTVHLNHWAHSQDRDLEQREAVLDALAKDGDADIIDTLRHAIPLTGQQKDIDPSSPSGQQWLSNASILARNDTVLSMPAIITALTAAPALARPFLDRLASDSGLGGWPMDLSVMQTQEFSDLYELITTYGPDGDQPLSDGSGALIFGLDQQLQRMRSELASILARRGTQEAADELRALANRHPDHWQLRELARQLSRDVAELAWRPIGIEDLLKIADDSALRLVRNEHQLSDVVIESIKRLQHLISVPNGWVTLLWHKSKADAASGWWPVWEEDLSDLVATFLQHDLAARQVIVNREVQILRPGLDGRRTDIHVQANPLAKEPDPEPLTVIIECKGCWNDDLAKGLSAQLVAKYLSMPGRNAGIYLVGYFDNPRWDHTKHPGRKHTAHDLEEVTAEQNRISREQAAQKSVNVTAFILDCRLPALQPARADNWATRRAGART